LAPRKKTSERGLGAEHQRIRKALLPYAYGKQCAMCGLLMSKDQALDLDHSLPRALGGTHGDRIVHASCNRSAGARLQQALRNGKPVLPRPRTSRRW